MNRQEAADFLGCHTRTISNYQRSGLLSPTKVGRELQFDLTELEELKRLKHEIGEGQLIPKKEILELRSRVSRLESQMTVINMVLDTKSGNLLLSPADAKDLYTQLRSALASHRHLSQRAIEGWIEVFYQITEETLVAVSGSNEDPDCWALFLDLCNLLIDHVIEDKDYEVSVDLQCRHRALCEARRRLRVSAVIFMERTGRVSVQITRRAPKLSPQSILEALRDTVKKGR